MNLEARQRRILIVEDDRAFQHLLISLLDNRFVVDAVPSGEAAIEFFEHAAPDIVLLDLSLPGIDGYETCRRMRAKETISRAQVIVVSARSSADEQVQAFAVGADDYVVKPIEAREFVARLKLHCNLLDSKEQTNALTRLIESRNLAYRRLSEERLQDLLATQDVAMSALAKLAEYRDTDTGEHLERMQAYSQLLAQDMARQRPFKSVIDQQFLVDLWRSSPLHDIGKVAIGDDILLKPGRLTTDEFNQMKQHVAIGAQILEDAAARSARGGFMQMAIDIARFHHEWFDGTGYLLGLTGEDIPLAARIVAVADVYDALTSERPYKTALRPEVAREMIERETGSHFDPEVVAALHRSFDKFLTVGRSHRNGQLSNLISAAAWAV
jgi:putative two-component system response regulator